MKYTYTVERSPRRTRLALQVNSDGAMTVLAPEDMSDAAIADLLERQKDWVESVRRRHMTPPGKPVFMCGDVKCVVERSRRRKRPSLRMNPDGTVAVLVPEGMIDADIAAMLEQAKDWIDNERRRLASPSGKPVFTCGDVKYTVERSSRRRRPGLQVNSDGTLTVFAPEDMSDDAIAELLERDKYWIDGERRRRVAPSATPSPAGAAMEYQVERSPRRKRASLNVAPDGTVTVLAPEDMSDAEMAALVEKHRDWIIRTRHNLMAEAEEPVVTFGGVRYRVERPRRRKLLALKMNPDGSLTILAPEGMRNAEIVDFLARNQDWLDSARRNLNVSPGAGDPMATRGNSAVEYQVERSRRRKRPTVYVNPDGTVTVGAPEDMSDADIAAFVESERDWIDRTRRSIMAEAEEPVVMCGGLQYKVERTRRQTRLGLKANPDGTMTVFAPDGMSNAEIVALLERNRDWVDDVRRRRMSGSEKPGLT